MTLFDLKAGESAGIKELQLTGDIRRRLLDIGFSEGATAQCVGISPLGDPKAYLIKGAIIALRSSEAKKCIIQV